MDGELVEAVVELAGAREKEPRWRWWERWRAAVLRRRLAAARSARGRR
ncbi:hypothetical protein ACWGB8_11070 [Kitasatospora sp. NPDC054939]